MKNLLALFMAFSAFFYSHLAWAQSPSPGAGWTQGISATGQSVWFGPANLTKSSAGMGQAIWNSVPSGVEVSRPVSLPFSGGVADVVPKVGISSAEAAGAIGRAVPKLLKQVAGPLGVGMILYDLGKELGFTLSKDSSDGLAVSKIDPEVCTVGPCYEYGDNSIWYKSPFAAADAWASRASATGGWTYTIISASLSGLYYYKSVRTSDGAAIESTGAVLAKRDVDPSVASDVSSNQQEFLDAVAAKSGWPSSSNLAKALQQSLDIEPLNYVPMVPLSTTGPASVSAPPVVETTNNGTDTTVKTTQKKTDLQYGTGPHPVSGAAVPKVTGSTVTNTTITVTNNTTGAVTTTNSTVNNLAEAKPEPEDLGSITDTVFADIPKLYERKYPDGITGVWNQKITGIKASPLFNVGAQLMPNLGSAGTCPHWMLPVNLAGFGDYGTFDISPPCFVWDFAKLIIIISSLLLARRLIFGG